MRITFIESFASDRQGFVAKRTYEVADPEARQFLKKKLARAAKSDEQLDVTTRTPAQNAAANVEADAGN